MRPRLIHRIDIEHKTRVQNPVTLEITEGWAEYKSETAARVTFLSGKELLSAQAEHAEVVARIQVNYDAGLNSKMRAKFRGAWYQFHAVLPDNETGLRWQTIMVKTGLQD